MFMLWRPRRESSNNKRLSVFSVMIVNGFYRFVTRYRREFSINRDFTPHFFTLLYRSLSEKKSYVIDVMCIAESAEEMEEFWKWFWLSFYADMPTWHRQIDGDGWTGEEATVENMVNSAFQRARSHYVSFGEFFIDSNMTTISLMRIISSYQNHIFFLLISYLRNHMKEWKTCWLTGVNYCCNYTHLPTLLTDNYGKFSRKKYMYETTNVIQINRKKCKLKTVGTSIISNPIWVIQYTHTKCI